MILKEAGRRIEQVLNVDMSWHRKEHRAKQLCWVLFRKLAQEVCSNSSRNGMENWSNTVRSKAQSFAGSGLRSDSWQANQWTTIWWAKSHGCSFYEITFTQRTSMLASVCMCVCVCLCVCVNTQRNINKYCQRNIRLVIPSACLLPSTSLVVFPLFNFDLNSMMAAILSFALHISLCFRIYLSPFDSDTPIALSLSFICKNLLKLFVKFRLLVFRIFGQIFFLSSVVDGNGDRLPLPSMSSVPFYRSFFFWQLI